MIACREKTSPQKRKSDWQALRRLRRAECGQCSLYSPRLGQHPLHLVEGVVLVEENFLTQGALFTQRPSGTDIFG